MHQLKIGALLSYTSIFINIITGLLYTPWMISCIGQENYGLYTLAMSVISLFVFDFGLSSAITRFISKYLAEGSQTQADNCLGMAYRFYLIIDIVMLLVLTCVFFFIPEIYKELTPSEVDRFKVVFVVASIFSVISFPFIPINGVLVAYEKFIQLRVCDVFNKLFVVATMTTCLLLDMGLYALVIVNAIAGVITIGLKLFCINRYTPQRVNLYYFNYKEFKQLVGYSGWVTIKSLSQRCIMNISPSILGIMSGSKEIAILGIAITLESFTYTFASAISGMFLPRVSRDVAHNIDILPLMTKVGRLQVLIIGLILIGLFLFGHEFISLWVGSEYNKVFVCVILMSIPSFFHLPQEIAQQAVYALNKVKIESQVYVLMAIINIIGAFVLSPQWGSIGISISIFVAYMIRTIGMDIIYYKKMNINVFKFFNDTYKTYILLLIPLLLFGLLINKYLPFIGWFGFGFKIGVFVISYCFLTYRYFLNDFEKQLLVKPIMERIGKK